MGSEKTFTMYKYKDVIFEDIERKSEPEYCDWSGICQKCVDLHKIDSIKIADGGSGHCMVLDCKNEADYYIDFDDGDLTEISVTGDYGIE